MDYEFVCALLKSEMERCKASKARTSIIQSIITAACIVHERNGDPTKDQCKNRKWWYCGRFGYKRQECRLRRLQKAPENVCNRLVFRPAVSMDEIVRKTSELLLGVDCRDQNTFLALTSKPMKVKSKLKFWTIIKRCRLLEVNSVYQIGLVVERMLILSRTFGCLLLIRKSILSQLKIRWE